MTHAIMINYIYKIILLYPYLLEIERQVSSSIREETPKYIVFSLCQTERENEDIIKTII